MSYNHDDFVRIKAEYSKKYLNAQEKANERRLELHAAIPAVRELDRLLSGTGLEIMAIVSEGGETEGRLAGVRRRNAELLAERGRLLRENGYPEDYSDVQYDCPLCGDTGYVGTKMCDCMRRALVEAGYESSGLGALIRTQSFDNFSLAYYDKGGQPERMKIGYKHLRAFSESFDRSTYRNFLLMGPTGLGKTHLSTSVARLVIERGFDVVYVTAISLLRDFEAKQFDKGVGMKQDTARYFEAELLIIDDLGTEVCNQFTLACLYDLINERINHHRCTMINTNLSFRELEARYNERITSRLLGEYQPILFAGTDIRRQKILEK